jgi:hypothetical protein
MKILLKNNQVLLIDQEDEFIFKSFKSWKVSQGYLIARKRVDKKTKYYSLHRLITNCPSNLQVDHINGNTLDNRRCNLRTCTQAQNAQNRPKSSANKSGYKGVSINKVTGKWIAVIVSNRVRFYLGSFSTREEAKEAYNAACKRLHGEFANTE